MKRILVVEDEEKIREVLVSYLKQAGFHVLEADTGKSALEIVFNEPPDLLLLDLMLPDLSGEDVCAEIRRQSTVPIIMLTAKSSLSSRLQGLEIGADDYIIKPFEPAEVIARIHTVLRRSDSNSFMPSQLSYGDNHLIINTISQEVQMDGITLALTPYEYKLLLTVARYPQRVFTRDELVRLVWGYDFEGDERTVDQHIKNLRQKIESDPKQPEYIQTVYGSGYRFSGGKSR